MAEQQYSSVPPRSTSVNSGPPVKRKPKKKKKKGLLRGGKGCR